MIFFEGLIFPNIGIFEGKRGGSLVDDLKGHSIHVAKEYITSFKSGDNIDPEEDKCNLFAFEIMA